MENSIEKLTARIDKLYAYKDVLEDLENLKMTYMKRDDADNPIPYTKDENAWCFDRYEIVNDLIIRICAELKIK